MNPARESKYAPTQNRVRAVFVPAPRGDGRDRPSGGVLSSRYRNNFVSITCDGHVSRVNTLPSPQDLQAKLEQALREAGFKDCNLVQVTAEPVGRQARYLVSVVRGQAGVALAASLAPILGHPLVGAYWILSLEEVQLITTVPMLRVP